MAILSVQAPPAALTYASAAAGGDSYPNTGREVFHVRNAGGSACVVTRNSQKVCDQGFDHDEVTSVPAGQDRMLAAASGVRFNDANGRVAVTYDQVSSVTVAVFSA